MIVEPAHARIMVHESPRPPGLAGWAHATAPLLDLSIALRGDKPFVPKGVHRFRSFEESDAWLLRMMTRPSKPARRG